MPKELNLPPGLPPPPVPRPPGQKPAAESKFVRLMDSIRDEPAAWGKKLTDRMVKVVGDTHAREIRPLIDTHNPAERALQAISLDIGAAEPADVEALRGTLDRYLAEFRPGEAIATFLKNELNTKAIQPPPPPVTDPAPESPHSPPELEPTPQPPALPSVVHSEDDGSWDPPAFPLPGPEDGPEVGNEDPLAQELSETDYPADENAMIQLLLKLSGPRFESRTANELNKALFQAFGMATQSKDVIEQMTLLSETTGDRAQCQRYEAVLEAYRRWTQGPVEPRFIRSLL